MKRLFLGLVVSTILLSCADEKDDPSGLSTYEQNVISYFQEVALGFEFGSASEVTRKWNTEMKIFIGGNPEKELTDELQKIVSEINTLATDGFQISITQDTLASNCYLFFGSATGFTAVYPPSSQHVANNYGLFYVNFDSENYLYKAVVYVDVYRANGEEQKHLMREELTQSLGLAKDSDRYQDSIFQRAWTTTTSYSTIDKDLIRLLYHPGMYVGLSKETSAIVLTQLIKELDI